MSGSPFSLTSVAVVVAPWLTKSRKLFMFGVAGSTNPTNGIYPPAQITAINSSPTIKVNGTTVSIGPPTWLDAGRKMDPSWRSVQCGSVNSIAMSNGGSGYSSPSATWNGDGGGTGLTVGTPTMQTGVTSYTVTTHGSGMADGVYDLPLYVLNVATGGNPTGVIATGTFTISDGQITGCVPRSGSPIAYGGGYSTSFSTSTFLSGGILRAMFLATQAAISGTTVIYTGTFPAGVSNGLAGASVTLANFQHAGNNGTFTVTISTATTLVVTNSSGVNETWLSSSGNISRLRNNSAVPGVLECNVSTYLTGIPVINDGSGFTSPPTFTITDGGSGSALYAVPIMTGPLSTDALTYSWAAGGITTNLGSTAVATNAPITNFGGCSKAPSKYDGIRATPTLPVGGNIQTHTSSAVTVANVMKNKYTSNNGWTGQASFSIRRHTIRSQGLQAARISTQFGMEGYDGTPAVPVGTYTLVYDDQYYAADSGLPGPTNVWISEAYGCKVTPGTPTVSGTTVTYPFTVALTVAAPYSTFWPKSERDLSKRRPVARI